MTAEDQVLRYAADLARLYGQVSSDRRRLKQVSETALELVRSLSLEDLAARLSRAAVEVLGLSSAAVYVARRDRFLRQGRAPSDAPFPAFAPIRPSDLEALGNQGDEFEGPPWSALTGGERVTVIPLPGRQRAVGFLVGEGSIAQLDVTADGSGLSLPMLLAGQAGVLLENQVFEERRSQSFRRLRAESGPASTPSELGIMGKSPAMQEVLGLVAKLAKVDSAILLQGETGTGKSLIARAVHKAGPREEQPFVTLNCGAIPEALVESELFGHEAGAFTGAQRLHRGKVEQASGGTLFLDEIGELPLAAQTKLLTFLEEKRFSRVGGEEELSADVRIVSATNADLEAAVSEKTFRSDLLYRLNVFTIELPPLRVRGADVIELARSLGTDVAERYGLPLPVFDPEAERRLLGYHWPGNVRELRNVMEKAVILADGGSIPPALLPAGSGASPEPAPAAASDGPRQAEAIDPSLPFADAKNLVIERWEIGYIRALLQLTGGNMAAACRLVKIDKKNLQKKVKRYGIDIQAIRDEAAED